MFFVIVAITSRGSFLWFAVFKLAVFFAVFWRFFDCMQVMDDPIGSVCKSRCGLDDWTTNIYLPLVSDTRACANPPFVRSNVFQKFLPIFSLYFSHIPPLLPSSPFISPLRFSFPHRKQSLLRLRHPRNKNKLTPPDTHANHPIPLYLLAFGSVFP